jgi:hypothetical protein
MGLPDRQPHLVSKPVGGDSERVRILCLTPNLPGPLRLISGSRPVQKATFREDLSGLGSQPLERGAQPRADAAWRTDCRATEQARKIDDIHTISEIGGL